MDSTRDLEGQTDRQVDGQVLVMLRPSSSSHASLVFFTYIRSDALGMKGEKADPGDG